MSIRKYKITSLLVLMLAAVLPAFAQEDAASSKADAAKKAANPICAIYAVPIEYDHYEKVGPYDGTMDAVTLKPVLPISINEDWVFVSRTIVPYVWQDGIVPDMDKVVGIHPTAGPIIKNTKDDLGYKYAGKNHGFWDIQESAFITPAKPMYGFLWGLGGAFGFPGEKQIAGITGKYTAGPTAAVVREDSIFTYGFLTNHQWSYAGRDKDYAKSGSENFMGKDLTIEADDVNKTYIQPFLTLRTKTYTGLSLTSESTYNWKSQKWSVPVVGLLTQVVKVGPQILQLKLGGHYWLTEKEEDPDGWGYRASVTLLYLK